MAYDGLFFKSVARIHPKFGVPANSILFQSVIAVLLAFSGTFEQVLTFMGFALGIFPVLTVLNVIKLRITYPMAPCPLPARMAVLTIWLRFFKGSSILLIFL